MRGSYAIADSNGRLVRIQVANKYAGAMVHCWEQDPSRR